MLEGLSVLALDLVNLRDVLLPPTQAPGAAVQGRVALFPAHEESGEGS